MSKILMVTEHFFPEIGSASNLFFELGLEFTKQGHDVQVITTFPRDYNLNALIKSTSVKMLSKEKYSGIEIIRTVLLPIPKDNLILRGLEQFWDSIFLAMAGVFLRRSDVILVYSPPLPLAFTSWMLSRIKKCKIIVNIQDIYPQTVIDVGLLKNRIIISIFKMIESFVYVYSDILTVHSESNRDYLVRHGAPEGKVNVVYNWVDTDSIRPIAKPDTFEGINLNGKFVVSYAGILSAHQGLDIVLKAAKILEGMKDIIFLFAGDGFAKNNIMKMAADLKLGNLIFLPFQPMEKYNMLLGSSDVSLVCLSSDVATPVVPGKLMSIMASGRPVIACVPKASDTVHIVNNANCGIVVEAGSSKALADAIMEIYNDKTLAKKMGENGRSYANSNFSLSAAIANYEKILRINGIS
jgi:glycosyltransferase involved in cell wall biosynthesis